MSNSPIFFSSPAKFREWLESHSSTACEVVVGYVKTHTGRAAMTWPQSVDEALCFGWIDGVRKRIDEDHYQIRFTPRKSNSHWSAVNIERVAVLKAEGRMTEAGLAAFAKRTEAKSKKASYEQEEFPELSPSEIVSFKKNRKAWAFYEKLPPSYRRKANWIVISAKRVTTRERRFQDLVKACEEQRRQN